MEDYDHLGPLKRLLETKMFSLCSQIMCDRIRSLHDIARQIGLSFGAVRFSDVQGLS